MCCEAEILVTKSTFCPELQRVKIFRTRHTHTRLKVCPVKSHVLGSLIGFSFPFSFHLFILFTTVLNSFLFYFTSAEFAQTVQLIFFPIFLLFTIIADCKTDADCYTSIVGDKCDRSCAVDATTCTGFCYAGRPSTVVSDIACGTSVAGATTSVARECFLFVQKISQSFFCYMGKEIIIHCV
jgi:hypothetical protein